MERKTIVSIVRWLFLALFFFIISKGNMMLWLGLYGASLILALLFGRIYCGYICPMNTLMVPAEWISKKLKIQSKTTPKFLQSSKLPWITLVGSLALMIFSKRVLQKNIPLLLIWVIVSVLVTLRYKPEVFHNLICPFGALQKVFGKSARLSKNVEEDACIGCKLCEKDCPSAAIKVQPEDKKAIIDRSLCFQCTNCQDICPKDAINYTKTTKYTKA